MNRRHFLKTLAEPARLPSHAADWLSIDSRAINASNSAITQKCFALSNPDSPEYLRATPGP